MTVAIIALIMVLVAVSYRLSHPKETRCEFCGRVMEKKDIMDPDGLNICKDCWESRDWQ